MKLWERTIFNTEEKKEEAQKLMLLALLPSVFAGIVRFGTTAFAILVLSLGTGILLNFIYNFFQKKEDEGPHSKVGDILICLFLGLLLPPGLPWYCVIAGSAFALLIGKYAFKVQGKDYFLNPALAAKAFLLLAFAGPMAKVVYRGEVLKTPLESLMAAEGVNTMKLFLGNTAGSIGTISILAVLLGAAFLLWFDVIHLETPMGVIAGFLIIAVCSGSRTEEMHVFHYLVAECCSGGLLFGAFFMTADTALLPKGRLKQLFYGLFIGLTAGCLRFYGSSKEGITYAILAGNLLLVPAARLQVIKEKRRKKKEMQAGDRYVEKGTGTDGNAGNT